MEFIKEQIIEKCVGCKRIEEENNTCAAAMSPKAKWRLGDCNLATHLVVKETKVQETKYKPKKFGKKRRGK